MLTELEFDRRL